MRLQPILFSVFGLLLIGGAFFLSESVLNPQPGDAATTEPREERNEVTLIAAANDIPFGEEILVEDLTSQTWPADLVPEGAFDSSRVLLGPDGTQPRRATTHLRAGDVITQHDVSDFGQSVTISYALSSDTRAMAINVNAATAVGGFVAPGDRVDIVLTEGRGDSLRTGTILQDIRVLGIDQDADSTSSRSREARTITVEVSPRDGQVLALAQQAGVLSLTLRNGAGDQDEEIEQITMADVWGDATDVVVIEPEPLPEAPRTVTVRRGVDEQAVPVE